MAQIIYLHTLSFGFDVFCHRIRTWKKSITGSSWKDPKLISWEVESLPLSLAKEILLLQKIKIISVGITIQLYFNFFKCNSFQIFIYFYF